MITITCTQCKTLLTMDEAFAGGVCRCQHCGTIQTVPSQLKHGGADGGAAAGQAVGTARSLYQQTRVHTDAASGLESLGDAATSSGLGSRRLQSPRAVDSTSVDLGKEPAQKNPLLVPLLFAVAVLFLLVIGLVAYLIFRSPASAPDARNTPGTPESAPPAVPEGKPSFCGTVLKGSNVVYLIDRGNSNIDSFDATKSVLYKSLHSLGADKLFQVVLWDNGSTPLSYPSTGLVAATDGNIDHLQDTLADITAGGRTSLAGVLKSAVAIKPDAIVIISAKTVLDDGDAAALKQLSSSGGSPLYLFAIGDSDGDLSRAMQAAASASDGAFQALTAAQLKELAQ